MTFCDFIVSIISSNVFGAAVGAAITCYLINYYNEKGEERKEAKEALNDLGSLQEDLYDWLDKEALKANTNVAVDDHIKAKDIEIMVRGLGGIKRRSLFIEKSIGKDFDELIKLAKGLISERSKKYWPNPNKDKKIKKLNDEGWQYINSFRGKWESLIEPILLALKSRT